MTDKPLSHGDWNTASNVPRWKRERQILCRRKLFFILLQISCHFRQRTRKVQHGMRIKRYVKDPTVLSFCRCPSVPVLDIKTAKWHTACVRSPVSIRPCPRISFIRFSPSQTRPVTAEVAFSPWWKNRNAQRPRLSAHRETHRNKNVRRVIS